MLRIKEKLQDEIEVAHNSLSALDEEVRIVVLDLKEALDSQMESSYDIYDVIQEVEAHKNILESILDEVKVELQIIGNNEYVLDILEEVENG